jgi:hypothetical protein
MTRVVRQVQENGGSQHAQPRTSTKSRQQINTHTQTNELTHTQTIAKRRAWTHTHTLTYTHTNHKSQKSHQHIHARAHKQIHTRNFAVIGESMTVSWLTGLLGLKQLDKQKCNSKCNVGWRTKVRLRSPKHPDNHNQLNMQITSVMQVHQCA